MADEKENNIELFDYYTGLILNKLYLQFPFRQELSINDLVKNENDLDFIMAVFDFLIEYDFIQATPTIGGYYHDTRLTIKGLAVLKAIPKSINENHKTNGEILCEAVKKGGKNMLAAASSAIISTYIQSL